MATKSTVNVANTYTKPKLRKQIVSQVMATATQGTGAGQWSGRRQAGGRLQQAGCAWPDSISWL